MRVGVVTFPGSNCDADARYASEYTNALFDAQGQVFRVWHKDSQLPADLDLVILPGGFSYGDYLRTGAIARFSPIMEQVIQFANGGGYVMGICNGFQILCECGLLPGALIRNTNLRFVCKDVYLRTERTDTAFTCSLASDTPTRLLRIPIAHGEGRYTAPPEMLDELEGNNQVLFRYVDASGQLTPQANPNGSERNIAGIINKTGNVMGMMPHPERAIESAIGSDDGAVVFTSLAQTIASGSQLITSES
ncbi:MAG: phosphoribosylformylglycinamidine synthase subunit PurQ [Bradyrhizobiaceae bacterium]|nr:phosphoribosylformylglycinamidine synthase subunit PurQ [Bradyrhizobiaceae bacterium]